MVVKIGELLNPGGRAFINVRGTDVKNASSKVAINESGMEYFISNTGSYQKGFTTKELVAYLRDALGDGFTVRATNKFGAVSAIVTKKRRKSAIPAAGAAPIGSGRAGVGGGDGAAGQKQELDGGGPGAAGAVPQPDAYAARHPGGAGGPEGGAKGPPGRAEGLEIKGEERVEVTKNKNRIDIAKNKAERYEAAVWELESKTAIKTLLKKSRRIVETEASDQARKEYRERQEEREMVNVTRRKVERNAKRLLEYMNTNTDKSTYRRP